MNAIGLNDLRGVQRPVMEHIAPMLASPSTSQGGRAPVLLESLSGDWWFQRKYDGVRAQLAYDGTGHVTLTGRGGNNLRTRFPEIVTEVLMRDPAEAFVLDGEIVLIDGQRTLADLLSRVKQTNPQVSNQLAKTMPAQFVAFDMLREHTSPLLDLPLEGRLGLLDLLANQLNLSLRHPSHHLTVAEVVSDGAALLEQTRRLGQEGVVAKLRTGHYAPGVRSYTWVKFKNTYTVFALAYAPSGEAGNGIALAVTGPDGKVRDVGSVGAGLRAPDRAWLAQQWAGGDFPVVLIECLGISTGGRLRQPVFKGLTGEPITVATGEQLSELPVST